jgi:hypothetical protein
MPHRNCAYVHLPTDKNHMNLNPENLQAVICDLIFFLQTPSLIHELNNWQSAL